MANSSTSRTIWDTLIHHVALPPRLPGRHDSKLDRVEQVLTERLQDASRSLRDLTADQFSRDWDCVRRILLTCKIVNAGGKLSKVSLLTAFRDLQGSDLLMLHIAEQNAGILIRRYQHAQEDHVLFEAFEASPLSEEVLASQNALEWDFPGCAVAIPLSEFSKSSFQVELATFLEKASTESIKRFAARATKAGSFVFESRETVDPSLITQMLMTLLEVNGTRIFPPLLRKRVRDDVCWGESGEKPWRRCPLWLLLRIGIHRHLSTTFGGEVGRVHYKFLICLVLALLMNDSMYHIHPEVLEFLKAKLCRRLVKLEVDKDRASPNSRPTYEYYFTKLSPLFTKSTKTASDHIDTIWSNFKRSVLRPVLPLPRRADQRHTYLTLPNSGRYIQELLAHSLYGNVATRNYVPLQLPQEYHASAAAAKKTMAFAFRYFTLSGLETAFEHSYSPPPDSDSSCAERCVNLASIIDDYLNQVADCYDSNTEQKSIMLLTIMELWMSMDECATKIFEPLKDYNPGFPSDILDVLQVFRFKDMRRIQKITEYIKERHLATNSKMNIFQDPIRGCFSEIYFNKSDDLQQLYLRIEAEAQLARSAKEQEWQRLTLKYEQLITTIAQSTCLYYENDLQIKVHDDRQCTKCFLQRKANRFRIMAHEHPLPSDLVQAKAVVFELACPKAFGAYRDATWRILGLLASPNLAEGMVPRTLLAEYSETRQYMKSTTHRMSLASTTKSFLITHYSNPRFPVGLEDVCLPNGLKLGFYDARHKVWPSRQFEKPTFAHHCRLVLPTSSPFSMFNQSPDKYDPNSNGPTSYEVVASQTKCPSGVNIHEFMAFQALVAGKTRRWHQILVELGSSNLNFSTEATTLLMSTLALQIGPTLESDPLGAVHGVFRDKQFSLRLVEQLNQRLDAISSNWRETNCMDTIITLTVKLNFLGVGVYDKAAQLLEKARSITLKWIAVLRSELQMSTDTETFQRCSRYSLLAALLCRRTFTMDTHVEQILEPTPLQNFIECLITIQYNLPGDPISLPPLLKNAFIRDLKMAFKMRNKIRRSLEANPKSLLLSISSVWPVIGEGSSEGSLGLSFFPEPNDAWVQFTSNASQHTVQQTLHFNLNEGYLLVNGQPVGKLPAQYRQSVILKDLFGDQSLLTSPSNLPGMTHMLPNSISGHQIHLGFRNGHLVVRARLHEDILELVPIEKFGNLQNFDLPATLVTNCVHWINLKTGIMEIRQRPQIWKSKASNWYVDFQKREARRRTSTLIDPHSPLFQRVARMFDRFEYRQYLTVYQPVSKPLSVELRRLELQFLVNRRNLLESPQLRSEIDPNQDLGTWNGLDSKIVLRGVTQDRDSIIQRQRTVIVPMGPLSYRLEGPHVRVLVENQGGYARFSVNESLGRLECPAEPRLLYLKAQFHAYTSFVVPDTLTGRTGTEEALHCLQSGYSQPWTPLAEGPSRILISIAKLTPHRGFYPKDMKVMQTVSWDAQLTTTIQHDHFRKAVEEIFAMSEQLSAFALQKVDIPALEAGGDHHLVLRSHFRRGPYQRPNVAFNGQQRPSDLLYEARDRLRASQGRANVTECSKLIKNWPTKIHTTSDLAGIMQTWGNIGGYKGSFGKILLTDLLGVQIAAVWGSLVNMCRISSGEDSYRLMFLFAMLLFRHDANMDVLKVLIAFGVIAELKVLDPPEWPSYTQFRDNQVPRVEYLVQLIKPCLVPYGGDERLTLQFALSGKQRRKLEATEVAYEQQQEGDSKVLAQYLLKQWPCLEPTLEGFTPPVLIDTAHALEIIRPEWERLFQNWELSKHLSLVQKTLDQHSAERGVVAPNVQLKEQEVLSARLRGGEFPILAENLICKTGPIALRHLAAANAPSQSSTGTIQAIANVSIPSSEGKGSAGKLAKSLDLKGLVSPLFREAQELQKIVGTLMESKSTVRQQYGADLMESLGALQKTNVGSKKDYETPNLAHISSKISEAQLAVQQWFDALCKSFERDDPRAQWLQQGRLWPILTPVTLLENLRSISICHFGDSMKESLIGYALSITALQRLLRMEDALQKGNKQRLNEEQENKGHTNWKPLERCDWLLLEIDSNFLIRPGQIDVANATISPNSTSNSVLQMNMGQGKTSCIMPMAAAVLANGKNLVKVVVPKPLLLQTAQLLHSRLGGLLGREIRHVPFSRKTPTKSDVVKAFFDIHKDIQKTSGVVVALPEHLLSFKLSGLQRLSDGRIPEAGTMLKIQSWMNRYSRSILDECDYTLAMRTQLIYPSGSQKVLDGHPHRWEVAESLLRMVDLHLWNLQEGFPQSIEVLRRSQGGFPVVFFLRKDVENALLERLVMDIYRNRTSILPRDCTKAQRLAIKEFISEPKVSPKVAEQIAQIFPDNPSVKQTVHLLRGLLVHRILLMTLKKRWNVQYGLHPTRDPIAVPYLAKGTPSEQAEWGHPEVSILFTCLAFYYDGLNTVQLRQSLEHVLKSDDPSQVYDRFSQQSNLPDSLRDWNAINVDDEAQMKEIWMHVRYNVNCVDYFLNNFVFPKHAKQFQLKLQASGWDIPHFSPGGQTLEGVDTLTTGFSGTNDWKRMLPLTITQRDLPRLMHTNAEVLIYLLQSRSRHYVLAADHRGRHLSELELLKRISDLSIRVLIDAGAQILEMDNLSLAKAWLDISHAAPAAVYFNQENKPYVVYRQGHQLPLLATPFADDLGDCLVYLDEAHTRGTDLKMPTYARGALTLGLGQTKDHTVQVEFVAAMRLRQLATTQSVTFFSPPEVHQSILDLRKKAPKDMIDSADVIAWLLEQTCSGIEQLQPLYFSQGADFCRRAQAALDNSDCIADSDQRETYLESLRQIEQQTLEQLYGVSTKAKSTTAPANYCSEIVVFMKELNRQRKGFQDTGDAVNGSALQEVEQEREVAYEVEVVRVLQKPVHHQPQKFPGLHKDIISFVKTGRLAVDSGGYEPAIKALRRTVLGRKYAVSSEGTSGKLFISAEFTRTIDLPFGRSYDNFQRQVNWILWSFVTGTALIIIPEEVEQIIKLINELKEPQTHVLTYAAPVTRKMLHFNDFAYYAVPSLPADWDAPAWLRIELGIFAGRLYFNFSEYNLLLEYLGLKGDNAKLEEVEADDDLGLDGAIDEELGEVEEEVVDKDRRVFTKKPLMFLQEWLALRRKGQDFSHTPMGHLCQGKPLLESHPFFTKPEYDSKRKETSHVRSAGYVPDSTEDDVDEDMFDDDAYGDDVGADEADTFDDSQLLEESGSDET